MTHFDPEYLRITAQIIKKMAGEDPELRKALHTYWVENRLVMSQMGENEINKKLEQAKEFAEIVIHRKV